MNGMGYSNVLLRDRDRGMKKGAWGGASRGLKYPRHTLEIGAYLGSLSKAHRRHVHQMLRQWIDLVRKRGFVDVVYVTAPTVLRYLRTAGVHWTLHTRGALGRRPGTRASQQTRHLPGYPSARRVQG